MLFNSYTFIFLFLPLTLATFYGFAWLKRLRLATLALALCSLGFYGYWRPVYLPLLLTSIIVNYSIGCKLSDWPQGSRKSRWILTFGLIFNLGLIAYYKYAAFVVTSFIPVPWQLTLQSYWQFDHIVLPLAISFFTFQQIAYLVDAAKGEVKGYRFWDYCLFVSFFPQLIAGPIVHHSQVVPQFYRLRTFILNQRNLSLGITAFILGLAKKVLIADNLSSWVAPVFAHSQEVVFTEVWVGALAYTFQLYFDFSGYSDMAIGLGLMFNIQLPLNFDSPYKAQSITEFWRRWHITLSNFLRDYLYIPLGGSRRGEWRRYSNLMITMLLGGLWHGAGWTFVLWGGLHGAYLCINHGWRRLRLQMPGFMAWGLTFLAVVVSWVLFRAETLTDGMNLLATMAGFNGVVLPGEVSGRLGVLSNFGLTLRPWGEMDYLPVLGGSRAGAIAALVALILVTTQAPNVHELLARLRPRWWWAAGVGLLGGVCLLSLNRVSEFLYFQF